MSTTFQKFAGVCAIFTGLAGLVYLASFLALKNPAALIPALALLLVGILAFVPLIAVYQRVRSTDEGFALWGLLLGIGGASGAAIHSAFDLSSNLHPPAVPFDYASPIDPRGFLTFAVAGLGAVVVSWLILRSRSFPSSIGYLGLVSGILLIALYLAYLVILSAASPLVLLLILLSGLAQPIWYLWLGWQLWQPERRVSAQEKMAPLRN